MAEGSLRVVGVLSGGLGKRPRQIAAPGHLSDQQLAIKLAIHQHALRIDKQ